VKKLLTAEVAEEKPQRPLRKASSEELTESLWLMAES
jgi:hypothetical protein